MGAYTKGPWRPVFGGQDGYVTCPDGRSFNIGDILYHPENKANAILIAAAPDIYEALIEARAMIGMGYTEEDDPQTIEQINKALDKAELTS